jgi:phosphoenolpyruvate carboxylase
MIQAKFGLVSVAAYQLENYTNSVLNATLDPPAPPRSEKWVELIRKLAEISCNSYRSVRLFRPLS